MNIYGFMGFNYYYYFLFYLSLPSLCTWMGGLMVE